MRPNSHVNLVWNTIEVHVECQVWIVNVLDGTMDERLIQIQCECDIGCVRCLLGDRRFSRVRNGIGQRRETSDEEEWVKHLILL